MRLESGPVLNVLLLAAGAAVSPTILAVVIVILHRPRPGRLLAAYLVGGMLTSVAVGIAIVTSLNELDVDTSSNSVVGPGVDLTVGALALLVAFVLATDRDTWFEARRREHREDRPTRDPWSERVLSHGSAPIAFAVGVALNLPGAFYLVALKDIAEVQDGTTAQIFAIVLFNLVMFVLVELPLLGYALRPETTQARVERLNDWMSRHSRQIVIAVAGFIGVYLIARGLAAVL